MPYIGHAPTNSGSFIEIDDFSSTFNGSGDSGTDVVAFTLQVGGVDITPNTANVLVALDGVLQQPPAAYSISGSTITFTEAPASGTDLYAVLIGQSASVGQGTVGASELKVSGNGSANQVLVSDGDSTFSWSTNLAGNAATATALATARTIGGTSFDGTANIAVGLAATATTLATARAINGVNFDGSAAITVTADANTLSNTTLKSTVVSSSLTSVGTLSSLTSSGAITLGTQSSGLNAFNVNRARFQSHENNVADMSVNLAYNGSAWVNDNDSQDSQLLRLYSGQGLTYYVSSAQATPNLSSKFSVDTSGNGTFAGTLTAAGNIQTSDNIILATSGQTNYAIDNNGGAFRVYRVGSGAALACDASLNTILYGHLYASTILIDGVSNYTGLEVKGSGGSRPQVKFTNANNGTLGAIYGTEGKDIAIIADTTQSILASSSMINLFNADSGSAGSTLKQLSMGWSTSTYWDTTNTGTFVGMSIANAHADAGTACGIQFAHGASSSGISYIVSRSERATGSGGDRASLHFGTRGSDGVQRRMIIGDSGVITMTNVYGRTVGATNRDVYIGDGGDLGYVSSVREHKMDIKSLSDVTWLSDLNPVSFYRRNIKQDGTYGKTKDGSIEYGLIADEVEKVNKDFVFYDIDEDENKVLAGVEYRQLIIPMLKKIQELSAKVEELENA